MRRAHRMPFGAEVLEGGGVRFRLWAPAAGRVEVALEDGAAPRAVPMRPAGDGWFGAEVEEAAAGSRYRFVIDGGRRVPDPASRFQPDDVHGPSEAIDPRAFDWRDETWPGRPWEEAVLYELHVGTFTEEGTFDGVVRRLDHLAGLGVTAVELMPLSDWPGARNWGYDGVLPYAPDSSLGRPERLKALIQAAHERELMVLLDVVYNHFGPEGNCLHAYAPQFFTGRHETPWGAAINFDGERSRTVRDFFIHNALYWLEEYGLDGLRLDAVHAIMDDSEPDILDELAATVLERVGPERRVHLVLENDNNAARYLARGAAGRVRRYVAQWNDDLHHALHTLVTGQASGYYGDYADAPSARLARALGEGFAYQGEPSAHRGGRPRGEPSAHLPPLAFVGFLQNHDQVGNRAFGERIDALAPEAAVAAALAVLLLAPSPPMLFMGEEWAAPQPFPFFCDFEAGLAEKVREGRRQEFAQFPEFADESGRARIPDPNAPATARQAVLDWDALARPPHDARLALCRALLALRHREIVPRLAGTPGGEAEGRAVGRHGVAARWRLGDGSQLALTANLGAAPLAAAAPDGAGRRLYATPGAGPGDDGVLPPWWVEWRIEERAAAAPR